MGFEEDKQKIVLSFITAYSFYGNENLSKNILVFGHPISYHKVLFSRKAIKSERFKI
jgi:hypothetical protein